MYASMTSHQVETELLSLAGVAQRRLGFLVASYQRPYVWKSEDVNTLFDDILRAHLNGERQYFIGNTLSARRGTTENPVYELIDGQQRTTSLMLISIAFHSLGVDCPLAKVALLGNESRLSFEIRDSVKNLLASFAGLGAEHATHPSAEEIDKDPYLKPLAANLKTLRQQVEALRKEDDFNLPAFTDFLYRNVIWVNNIVPCSMDLNRLFYSMNTAGIQLQPVDLLKARLLGKIKTEKLLYSTIWQACEHLDNYFERNLRSSFNNDRWNKLEYKELSTFTADFTPKQETSSTESVSRLSLACLLNGKTAQPEADEPKKGPKTTTEESDAPVVYCRSIVSFELLLIHVLRIYAARSGWSDLEPRIHAGNLLVCFEVLLTQDETHIKDFFLLLWQIRHQFDEWVVKWVERDDSEEEQLRLTSISYSQSYINRTAKESSELVQLQAVRNFTGERSAQYWLTPLLAELVAKPDMDESKVLAILERLDNQLSLTTETQKEASFKLAQNGQPELRPWEEQKQHFGESKGTSFEHYWFQKLEYLLWKQGDRNKDEKLRRYRITSKNSVEHVYPQNEEYGGALPDELLHAFGNLALLSPSENSSYSNQKVGKKKIDFDAKPEYQSLKLKKIFELYSAAPQGWTAEKIKKHQEEMIQILCEHYGQER